MIGCFQNVGLPRRIIPEVIGAIFLRLRIRLFP